MTVRIRPFRKGDGPAFLKLVLGLARYEKLQPPDAAARRRLVRDIGRRISVLLAEVDARAVGYAIYCFNYSSFLARPTLYLEDLFVLPDARSAGVGRKMWRELLRRARAKGCGRMEFIVLDWNKQARRFYEKLGAKRLKDWCFYRMDLTDGRLRRA